VTIVDGALEWREHPDPVAGDHDLLVAVRAAGLNGGDLMQRRGLYPAPPGEPPDIPGLELAGEVVAVGPSVRDFAVGDRVMAVVGGGGQAELARVPERHALAVPDDVAWAEAGGFPEVFTTAHDALFTQCGLTVGDRLCVHGAAGGVGVAAVQLGVLAGAQVTATVRDPDRRADVAALGDGVTVADPADVAAHGPFDVILELVGAPNLPTDLATLAIDGRIAVIGIGAGAKAEVHLGALMATRGVIRGSTLRPRSFEEKAAAARALARHALPALAAGRLRVPVTATFPLAEATAAYDRFAAGGKFGKIVLTG